jgi:proteasome lid subunit RPN8/RPN11
VYYTNCFFKSLAECNNNLLFVLGLRMETVHPCKVLMPYSTSVDCDTERNRIALEIQRLGHNVVGWYHSHPKAPPQPSQDDISRQLDYQIVMKGASESSYIPCVGVIICKKK